MALCKARSLVGALLFVTTCSIRIKQVSRLGDLSASEEAINDLVGDNTIEKTFVQDNEEFAEAAVPVTGKGEAKPKTKKEKAGERPKKATSAATPKDLPADKTVKPMHSKEQKGSAEAARPAAAMGKAKQTKKKAESGENVSDLAAKKTTGQTRGQSQEAAVPKAAKAFAKRDMPGQQQQERAKSQLPDLRTPQEKRMVKKAGRRAEQLAKLNAKAQAEANYFWEVKARQKRGKDAKEGQSQSDLFGQQTTFAIDFSKYDSVEVSCSGPGSENHTAVEDFANLGKVFPKFLLKNLKLMNYQVPTPIQKHAVPFAMRGLDLMCCAQTGSGKTCAFLLPVVASLAPRNLNASDANDPARPRCVIMAPTRELIQQIHIEALKCCHNSRGLRAVVIYGGANVRQQLAELAQGCDIAVATPGRLTDFVDRGLVQLQKVEHLVLDEADRMLDMGFEPQIRKLVQNRDMPSANERRTMMFSATFPSTIQKLAEAFLKPYVFIAVGRVGATTENIEQRLLLASSDKHHKFELTLQALGQVPGKTLIFVQKKRVATLVKKWLRAQGISAEDIHGDRSQSQREAALAMFKSGKARILCATDVAARGLDIPSVAHVINFDLPTSPDEFDSYVHRIGRTGRAGNTGISTSFYVPGYDPKVGNAGIAPALLRLFKETGNDIPGWFSQLPESRKAIANVAKKGNDDIRSGNAVRTQTSTKAIAKGKKEEKAKDNTRKAAVNEAMTKKPPAAKPKTAPAQKLNKAAAEFFPAAQPKVIAAKKAPADKPKKAAAEKAPAQKAKETVAKKAPAEKPKKAAAEKAPAEKPKQTMKAPAEKPKHTKKAPAEKSKQTMKAPAEKPKQTMKAPAEKPKQTMKAPAEKPKKAAAQKAPAEKPKKAAAEKTPADKPKKVAAKKPTANAIPDKAEQAAISKNRPQRKAARHTVATE